MAMAKINFCHYNNLKNDLYLYFLIIIMNSFIIDIIALFILLIGIIWMHNNTLNFKKIAYILLIILIIDLRIFLKNF